MRPVEPEWPRVNAFQKLLHYRQLTRRGLVTGHDLTHTLLELHARWMILDVRGPLPLVPLWGPVWRLPRPSQRLWPGVGIVPPPLAQLPLCLLQPLNALDGQCVQVWSAPPGSLSRRYCTRYMTPSVESREHLLGVGVADAEPFCNSLGSCHWTSDIDSIQYLEPTFHNHF